MVYNIKAKLNRMLILLIALVGVSCSLQTDTIIPTVAILPTAQTSPSIPSPSALPTFTLLPPRSTPTPNWLDIESKAINRVLPIYDGKTISRFIASQGNETNLTFFYEYKSDVINNDSY